MEEGRHSRNFLTNLPLNWKFSLIVLLPLLLMGIFTTLAIENSLKNHFHHELLDNIYEIGDTVAAGTAYHLLENDPNGVRNLLDFALGMKKELTYLYVTDSNHRLIARTLPQEGDEADSQAIPKPGGDVQEITVPMRGGKLGDIHLGFSEASFHEQLERIRNLVLYVTLGISIPGLIALLFLFRLITRPLALLTRAADQVSQGQLEVNLPTSDDEVGQLALAFNRMAAKLGNQQKRRTEAEKALREKENLYRTLLDNINLGIILIDKEFKVLLANAGEAKLFHRAPEEFIGKKCYEIFRKGDRSCPNCPGYKAMRSGRVEESETRLRLDDGTQLQLQIKVFPVRDENREVQGFIEITNDISTRKQLEDDLQRIKNIETIGQLAGGLAHDFNNLLTTLIGNIELSRAVIPPDNDAHHRLDAAESACEQAQKLTNQLLTFAKGGMPVKKITNLTALLNEACHFTLSGTNLHYVVDAPAHLWPVEIDPNQMAQVIHNLLTNAKEAIRSKPAGKIFLTAENFTLVNEATLPLSPGRYVKITIADEGCGIRNEDLDRIFHPYFTTKNMDNNRGTGLGLTICHSIVHKHGGHITVESEANLGTTLSIYIPAAEPAGPAPADFQPAPRALAESQPTGQRILHLEDEEELAHIAKGYLVSLHHHYDLAHTGQEALRMVRESLAKGEHYNLLILDLTIRGSQGGEEVLKQIRRLQPGVAAIVSSGYTSNPIMINYREHGFQAALPKPFNFNSLRAAIDQAMSTAV